MTLMRYVDMTKPRVHKHPFFGCWVVSWVAGASSRIKYGMTYPSWEQAMAEANAAARNRGKIVSPRIKYGMTYPSWEQAIAEANAAARNRGRIVWK